MFWIKKTRNSIPRLYYSNLFWIRFAVFEIGRFLENIFQKKLDISKTANRIKKVFWIIKTHNLIPRLFYSKLFLIRFAVFEIERFLENIFQKKALYLENGESDQKIVLDKKDAKFNCASFLIKTLFDPIRRFWDRAFFLIIFQKKLNISKTANRIKKVFCIK